MIQVMQKAKSTVKGKLLLILCAVVGAVTLPQIVHMIGRATGSGNALGELLLPMHFFVLLAGLFAGPAVGAVTGALAPLISYLLSGMPGEATLPFMMIELLGYGLVAGLLSEIRLNGFVKLLIAQIAGRALRAVAVLLAVYAFDVQAVSVSSIWNMVRNGLLGIILQWCIIPLLLFYITRGEDNSERNTHHV